MGRYGGDKSVTRVPSNYLVLLAPTRTFCRQIRAGVVGLGEGAATLKLRFMPMQTTGTGPGPGGMREALTIVSNVSLTCFSCSKFVEA